MTHEQMFKYLHSRFPKLITNDTMLSIDVGWDKLVYGYCEMFEALYQNEICELSSISEIKEKFGSMRLHHDIDADEVGYNICRAVIFNTEYMSTVTCERCGKWGKIVNDNGWLRCLCVDCRGEVVE